MKKRIGTKLYDTDKSELIAETADGKIYRKRTRARDWFIVTHDGQLDTIEENNVRDLLGDEVYNEKKLPDTDFTWIRVDRKTHGVIFQKAKEDNVSITEEVKRIIECRNF